MEKNMKNVTSFKFGTNTKLSNVEKLCDQTFSYSVESETKDMKSLYEDDLKDYKFAINLFCKSDAEALNRHVDHMDTSSREQLVMAFHKDLGSKFVEDVLGYEVRV